MVLRLLRTTLLTSKDIVHEPGDFFALLVEKGRVFGWNKQVHCILEPGLAVKSHILAWPVNSIGQDRSWRRWKRSWEKESDCSFTLPRHERQGSVNEQDRKSTRLNSSHVAL